MSDRNLSEEHREKLAAALAELAAQKAPKDYPDWSRARRWCAGLGSLAGMAALLLGVGFRSWRIGGNAALVGLGVVLIVGAVAAFRPES